MYIHMYVGSLVLIKEQNYSVITFIYHSALQAKH